MNHYFGYGGQFSETALPKKCAIITDGDLVPSDADPALEGEDDLPAPLSLGELENDYVKVFACKTTFERALVFEGTLKMFALAADDIGAPLIAKRLREGLEELEDDDLEDGDRAEILKPLRKAVLNTAKRFGKARFAQVVTRHVGEAKTIPSYLTEAVKWLHEE